MIDGIFTFIIGLFEIALNSFLTAQAVQNIIFGKTTTWGISLAIVCFSLCCFWSVISAHGIIKANNSNDE